MATKYIPFIEEFNYPTHYDQTQNLLAYQPKSYFFPEDYEPDVFDFENAKAKETANFAADLIMEDPMKLEEVVTGLRKMGTHSAKMVLWHLRWMCKLDAHMPNWIPEPTPSLSEELERIGA